MKRQKSQPCFFFLTLQPLIRRIFLALRFHTFFNENFTLEGLSTVNKVSPMGKNKQLQPVWLNSDSLFQFAHKVIQRSKKLSMYSHDNFLMKEKNSKRRHLVGSYFRSWKRRWEKNWPVGPCLSDLNDAIDCIQNKLPLCARVHFNDSQGHLSYFPKVFSQETCHPFGAHVVGNVPRGLGK